MATRNNAVEQAVEQSEEQESLPEEFAEEETYTGSDAPLNFDDYADVEVNEERDERIRATINPPTGDWDKDDRWNVTVNVRQDDSELDDIDPEGRTVFVVSGKPKPREYQGISYQPTLFFRFSPDLRYKADKPDEVDHAHKLYIKAKDTYVAIHKRKGKLRDLLRCMAEDSYTVRTMNGDNGPVVMEIKQTRQRR